MPEGRAYMAIARAMARTILASRSAEQRPSTAIAAGSGVKNSGYAWTHMVVLWRVFQIVVVVPSSIVGGLLLIYALNGHSPVIELVTGVHDWAEMSVRPAPAGMVLIVGCNLMHEDSATDKGAIRPPVLCKSSEAKPIPVDEYARSVNLTVRVIYGVLLGLAFVVVVAAYPGRRFVGYVKTALFKWPVTR